MKALGKYLNNLTYIDHDYRDKLSKEDNEWLHKFDSEYYTAYGLNLPDSLHDPSYNRSLYQGSNERRRDLLNQANISLMQIDEDDVSNGEENDS